MEAWGSHCPRYTVWEDALAAGLVEVDAALRISLTRSGQSLLPD